MVDETDNLAGAEAGVDDPLATRLIVCVVEGVERCFGEGMILI